MRTPGLLIFGLVLSSCGWVLDLTSTVAPNWRTVRTIAGEPQDLILQQGIWDICRASETSREIECNQPDVEYFGLQIIDVAQGLMVASLLVTLLGLAVAIPGIRCWRDRPNFCIAGIGGIFIFLSGVMTIIPIAWYTHIFNDIAATGTDVRVGFCIVLGYIGGIMEVLAGAAMVFTMCSCCGGKNRGEKPPERQKESKPTKFPLSLKTRKVEVPSISRSRSNASSVPYSRDSLDDIDFPRAKSQGNRSNDSSYGGRPYDADL